MYLDDIAIIIRSYVPEDKLPKEHVVDLFRLYAVLLRAKGTDVTESDIHDAWSMWIVKYHKEHESLVPYEELPLEVREQDLVFVDAIRRASRQLYKANGNLSQFEEVLFPSGPPYDIESRQQTIDQYKLMVSSSESLVNRRQAVNTFFLTMNGALLTAFGLIVKGVGLDLHVSLGVLILAITGAILCGAWRSLIKSFGQLNKGKFKVINTIERYLNTAIYAAEWEALEHGDNPKVYRSFTSREIWVPTTLLSLYIITALVAIILIVIS
ncbi:hypothetical protein [Sphaerochaeta sp. S2]|uniref:RipA family octameric membrane protein n=1 Tax=Sphaerochaeta sp. S2 TaxID=2798868 RepID=UPI0018E91333|nr:hypothetical protein [Sphaerochaeta sp. S2]MBJ2357141.1 hypothetical protein [Sphaerochaeta sp. S2]